MVSDQQIMPLDSTEMSASARNYTYKLQGVVTFLRRYRISPPAAASSNPGISQATQGFRRDIIFSNYYLGYGGGSSFMNQGFRSFIGCGSTNLEPPGKPHDEVLKGEDKKAEPPFPVSDKQGFSAWAKWLLGSFLTLMLPFFKLRWERLMRLEGKAETAVEEAEVVAELVENAAAAAEKVSSEVAEKLPDHSKIKQAVLLVERISSVTAQEAQLADDFIHKVGEVKHDLEEMKTILEPAIDKIVKPHPQQQDITPPLDNK